MSKIERILEYINAIRIISGTSTEDEMQTIKMLATEAHNELFGWCEDNNRAFPKNEKVVAKVQTEEQKNFILEKLNNKYVKHLRSRYV